MTRFCTQCGAQLTEQDQFCAQCGSPSPSRSAQPARAVGQPQTAPPTPSYAPSPQQHEKAAAPTPMPPDYLPSSSRFRFPTLLVVVVRTLCLAVGLDIFFMLCSLAQDIDRNLPLNTWSPSDTPMQLQQHAFRLGRVGLGWGVVIGGIAGWRRIAKERRMERR